MVSYQDWTRIAFNVAESRGFDPSSPTGGRNRQGGRGFDTENPNAQAIQVFADIWQDRKEELQTASRSEAREVAKEEVHIS